MRQIAELTIRLFRREKWPFSQRNHTRFAKKSRFFVRIRPAAQQSGVGRRKDQSTGSRAQSRKQRPAADSPECVDIRKSHLQNKVLS